MTAEQRKQKISELLKENDSVKVTELSQLFNVSEVTVRSYLEDMEKKAVLIALERNKGKRRQAAKDLNISERTLYRKIKEYGIE